MTEQPASRFEIRFTVPGKPAPQGSKRHVGNGRMVESSKDVGPWRERVAYFGRQAMYQTGFDPLSKCPLEVELFFVMVRPTSAPKRTTPPAIKRPDIDKLSRAVLDALTFIVFDDDSQVVSLKVHKRIAEIGEPPGVHITVTESREGRVA
jgi:crossover junction endodeoxyribonuclease RusA